MVIKSLVRIVATRHRGDEFSPTDHYQTSTRSNRLHSGVIKSKAILFVAYGLSDGINTEIIV